MQLTAALALLGGGPAHGADVVVTEQPFSLRIGELRLAPEPEWRRATVTRSGATTVIVVEAGPTFTLVAGDGETRMAATASSLRFETAPGERFFGFGSRSNAVDHAGGTVVNDVEDGPVRPEDRLYPQAFVPPWAHGDRDDSTYYPVPWLLSSRGFGVLVDRDEQSAFALGSPWQVSVQSGALALRVFDGPTPADALRRFTAATGRQPEAAPWAHGAWFQTGQPNRIELDVEARILKTLRDAGAPVSVAETQMHHLPCGAHRDDPAYNRARTEQFHRGGVAHLVYFNPSLCVSYQPVWQEAAAAGLLIGERAGTPHVHPAFVGGSGPAGFTTEPLSQFDFTAPGAEAFYERLLREAVDGGVDGWMEDFGEGVPPHGVAADGTTGSALHNRYPRDYHCAVQRIAGGFGRPVVRHVRSGWTGSAACSPVVWGGDPTTVWDFDGLQSAVRQALGMGLSGVSRFGTDIGGYNTYGPWQNLTPELLRRWIQFGAVSGAMRTKWSGLAFPSYDRPQIVDPEVLPTWVRYSRLRTALHPYLLAADASYRATGMPLMRHYALIAGADAAVEDAFGVGPDLVAAPVTSPGLQERAVVLPPGRWLDWWRPSAAAVAGRVNAGAAELPLFVRAGAVVPLLGDDVQTLAPYGEGLVRAADREHRRRLVAFPRGRWTGALGPGERLGSTEARRRWTLTVGGVRRRTYSLTAHLQALRRPFRPCRVTVAGRRHRFAYDRATRTLRVAFKARRAKLRVHACR